MDPLSLLTTGISLFGIAGSYETAQKMAQTAHQKYATEGLIAQSEIDINNTRHQEMLLTSQRQQFQNLRNMQLARSMALTSATAQGAQFGSGLPGALGQISGQGENNALALNQNTALGNKVFGDQNQIDYYKMGISGLNSQMSDETGQMALYNSITQSASPLSKFATNIFQTGKLG